MQMSPDADGYKNGIGYGNGNGVGYGNDLCSSLINKSHSSAKGDTKGAQKGGSRGIGNEREMRKRDGWGMKTCRTHVKHENHALPLNGQMESGEVRRNARL